MGKNKDKVKALIKEVANDEELACRVRQASLDELRQIAKEKGVDISRKELRRAIEDQGERFEKMADKLDNKGVKGANNLRAVAEWSG